jgi:hypothetical protein
MAPILTISKAVKEIGVGSLKYVIAAQIFNDLLPSDFRRRVW